MALLENAHNCCLPLLHRSATINSLDLSSNHSRNLAQSPPEALSGDHEGGDYFEVMDFVDAIQGRKPPTIGIHEAMDMTLPGLVSQESIRREGEWLPVPDSRLW